MNLHDWRNLKDLQINVDLSAPKGWTLGAEPHRFWLASRRDGWSLNPKFYRDESGEAGDDVGKELDLLVRYDLALRPSHRVSLRAGYAHFFPDRFVQQVADDEGADWLFTQLAFQISF